VDKTEWVNQIRTVTTVGSNYFIQESCTPTTGPTRPPLLRPPVYNLNRAGTCTIAGPGLTNGEPG